MSTKKVRRLKEKNLATAGGWDNIELQQYAHGDASFTLAAADWQGASAPYEQTVGITSANGGDLITANCFGIFSLSMGATDEQYTAAARGSLRIVNQGAGSVTVKSYGVKPTVDIPCVITGIYEPY